MQIEEFGKLVIFDTKRVNTWRNVKCVETFDFFAIRVNFRSAIMEYTSLKYMEFSKFIYITGLPATLGHFNHPAAATQAIQLSCKKLDL